MIPLAPTPGPPAAATSRAVRRLLREENSWLLRQIGSERPVIWLRPQPLGSTARHGILALRTGVDGLVNGALRADVIAWPWADDSIPAIVLQHVVEGASWGDDLLAEAARVLQPEGRLYIVRFDRLSPWYWRHGRRVAARTGARMLTRPLDLRCAHRQGLSVEYRHALGPRGLGAQREVTNGRGWLDHRWPAGAPLRAARIVVLRKRVQRFIATRARDQRAPRSDFGLAAVRRVQGDA